MRRGSKFFKRWRGFGFVGAAVVPKRLVASGVLGANALAIQSNSFRVSRVNLPRFRFQYGIIHWSSSLSVRVNEALEGIFYRPQRQMWRFGEESPDFKALIIWHEVFYRYLAFSDKCQSREYFVCIHVVIGKYWRTYVGGFEFTFYY